MDRHDAEPVTVPVLYLRGTDEGGDLAAYRDGLTGAGLTDVRADVMASAGHYAADDAPGAVWGRLAEFMEETG